jgi:hypothetical protein
MSEDEKLKKIFKELTDRERLIAFLEETRTPYFLVRGYADILARIRLDDPSTFPADYHSMVEALGQANERIGLLLDILISVLQEDQTK